MQETGRREDVRPERHEGEQAVTDDLMRRLKRKRDELAYGTAMAKQLGPVALKGQATVDDATIDYARQHYGVRDGSQEMVIVQLVNQIVRFRASMMLLDQLKGMVENTTLQEVEAIIGKMVQPKAPEPRGDVS